MNAGDQLIELAQSATTRIVIVAPYIKTHALHRLIDVIPESITSIICVTRWLPEDIASGVCDLEIFDVLSRLKGGILLIHPLLHAKYYATEKRCLIGSSNLTGRGLGWHASSNVELLVSLPIEFEGLRKWEASLLESSIPATKELRNQLEQEANRLKETMGVNHPPEVEGSGSESISLLWYPTCPSPDKLWLVYQGIGAEQMVSSAYKAAQRDLMVLRPPAGLAKQLFETYISSLFRHMPLIMQIDRQASIGLTDSQALKLLVECFPTINDISHEQVWRIIKLWLIYFLPTSYRVETGHEVLVKGQRLLPL